VPVRGLVVLALAASLIGEASAQDLQASEARAFFDRYVALSDAYDSSLAELYSDNARIRSARRYPDGQSRALEMTGTQWKGMIRSAMPLAKAQGDRSDFKNVRVERAGELMRIQAERYSVRKCYWDRGYYMLIGRQSDGRIRIVEEYLETQPQSNC
jgi:hypothetical protein